MGRVKYDLSVFYQGFCMEYIIYEFFAADDAEFLGHSCIARELKAAKVVRLTLENCNSDKLQLCYHDPYLYLHTYIHILIYFRPPAAARKLPSKPGLALALVLTFLFELLPFPLPSLRFVMFSSRRFWRAS